MAYWIEFEDRPPACHGTARTEDEARAAAAVVGTVKRIGSIGYPARPRLDPEKDTFSADGFPSFCTSPRRCIRWEGGASCANPHGRSCTS